jgi:hypothetical protein
MDVRTRCAAVADNSPRRSSMVRFVGRRRIPLCLQRSHRGGNAICRFRTVPLPRAGTLLMAVAIALQTGCLLPAFAGDPVLIAVTGNGVLNQKTLEEWGARPLESSRVEVVSAGKDRVVLGWETTSGGGKRSGELEFDPHMPDCEDVQVFINFGSGGRQGALVGAAGDIIFGNDGRQGALVGAAGDIPPRVPLGPCHVDILVQRLPGELLLKKANTPGRPPAYAHIKTPRNHLWLAVVPLAVTADVLLAILGVGA